MIRQTSGQVVMLIVEPPHCLNILLSAKEENRGPSTDTIVPALWCLISNSVQESISTCKYKNRKQLFQIKHVVQNRFFYNKWLPDTTELETSANKFQISF